MCFWTNENFLECQHGRQILTGICFLKGDKPPEECEMFSDFTYHWTEGKCPGCVEAERIETARQGIEDTHLGELAQRAHMEIGSFETQERESQALSTVQQPASISGFKLDGEIYSLDVEEFETLEDENDENQDPQASHADMYQLNDEMVNWYPFETQEDGDDGNHYADENPVSTTSATDEADIPERMDLDGVTPERRWNYLMDQRYQQVMAEGRAWTCADQSAVDIAFRTGAWDRKEKLEDELDAAEDLNALLD